ncbi:MAG TPA: hypothetical protein VGG56_15705 [Terracidiphilus sp.]|jgi:hypothetical protein
MQEALAQLESTYLTMQPQIGLMLNACPSQGDRDTITTKFVAARQNYWSCVNKAFHDDDPQVISLTTDLTTANTALKTAVTQLDDIKKTIDAITQAVTVGASLAAEVITV